MKFKMFINDYKIFGFTKYLITSEKTNIIWIAYLKQGRIQRGRGIGNPYSTFPLKVY